MHAVIDRLLMHISVLTVIEGIVLYLSISIALLAALAFQKALPVKQLTLCRSFHADALQATASKGLAQTPYVAARARFATAILRSKGIDSTNAPLRLTTIGSRFSSTGVNLRPIFLTLGRATPPPWFIGTVCALCPWSRF